MGESSFHVLSLPLYLLHRLVWNINSLSYWLYFFTWQFGISNVLNYDIWLLPFLLHRLVFEIKCFEVTKSDYLSFYFTGYFEILSYTISDHISFLLLQSHFTLTSDWRMTKNRNQRQMILNKMQPLYSNDVFGLELLFHILSPELLVSL